MLFSKPLSGLFASLPLLSHAIPHSQGHTWAGRQARTAISAYTASDMSNYVAAIQDTLPTTMTFERTSLKSHPPLDLNLPSDSEAPEQPICRPTAPGPSSPWDWDTLFSCAEIRDFLVASPVSWIVPAGECQSLVLGHCRLYTCVSSCAGVTMATPSGIWAQSANEIGGKCDPDDSSAGFVFSFRTEHGELLPGEGWVDGMQSVGAAFPPTELAGLCIA